MHPLAHLQVPRGSAAIHWFEQSTYAVKDPEGTTLMIDPYFPKQRPAEKFIHAAPPHDESQLPLHFVLLTHNHRDHTWPESLCRIHARFPKVQYFGPFESVANIAENTPIPKEQVTTISAGDTLPLASMKATAIYAKPPEGDPARQIPPPDVTHLAFVLEAGPVRMYFSGDLIHSFPERDDLLQAVARLKPEIGFLTNHPSEGEFPFFAGSAKMAQSIGLKVAVPAHYECFVKRNYDPRQWAAAFPPRGPQPRIVPRNSHILYPG